MKTTWPVITIFVWKHLGILDKRNLNFKIYDNITPWASWRGQIVKRSTFQKSSLLPQMSKNQMHEYDGHQALYQNCEIQEFRSSGHRVRLIRPYGENCMKIRLFSSLLFYIFEINWRHASDIHEVSNDQTQGRGQYGYMVKMYLIFFPLSTTVEDKLNAWLW